MMIRLRWKITIVFCFFTILTLSGLYIYLNRQLKELIDTRIQSNLKKEIALTKALIENTPDEILLKTSPDALADSIGKALDIRASIISSDGTVTGDSDLSPDEIKNLENHLTRPEIQSSLTDGFGQNIRFSTTVKKNMLYLAMPIGKGGSSGFIRLSVPLSDIGAVEASLRRILSVALLFAIAITAVLNYILSFIISKPLADVSRIAGQMASGDFSKRALASRSSDEIGELAKTLNYLSEKVQREMRLVSSEEAKLEAVLWAMFEGVMLVNAKGEILLMNPSIRRLLMVYIPPEGKKPLEVIRNTAVQDIVSLTLEKKIRLTGEEITVNAPEERIMHVNAAPIIKDGRTEGAILVFHDITELRRLERIRRDFVANVSHELRTPVSSIKGYAETLIEGAINDKKNAMDFVKIIHHDSERLANLINDLLDLSGIESGKMKMVFLPTELADVISRSKSIVDKQAKSKRLLVETDISQKLPRVLADETRISQVIVNLLDNAIKYTDDNGKITITARPAKGLVQIDVSDTGIGIPEKDMPRIFERFYRVDKAHSRELGGTGLGLSIAKHIVQAHGGEIWLKSKPGQGSTFSFTIPTA